MEGGRDCELQWRPKIELFFSFLSCSSSTFEIPVRCFLSLFSLPLSLFSLSPFSLLSLPCFQSNLCPSLFFPQRNQARRKGPLSLPLSLSLFLLSLLPSCPPSPRAGGRRGSRTIAVLLQRTRPEGGGGSAFFWSPHCCFSFRFRSRSRSFLGCPSLLPPAVARWLSKLRMKLSAFEAVILLQGGQFDMQKCRERVSERGKERKRTGTAEKGRQTISKKSFLIFFQFSIIVSLSSPLPPFHPSFHFTRGCAHLPRSRQTRTPRAPRATRRRHGRGP